jgi:hypothetical protein
MSSMIQTTIRRAATVVALAGLLAACGESTSSSAAGGSSSSGAGSPRSGAPGVTADLTISGDRTASLKGTKGTCSGRVPLTVTLSGADYADLGPSGAFSATGPGASAATARFKVLVANVGFLSGMDAGITASADGKTLTFNSDAAGGRSGTPEHIHIAGTVTCG